MRGFAYLLFAATAASMMHMIALIAFGRAASQLGLYLPLVAFTCAMTGIPDAFDVDHELEDSLVRSVLRGITYLVVLTLVGCVREVLGVGAIFGSTLGEGFQPMRMLSAAPGGLMLAGLIVALIRAVRSKREKGGEGA
jgi:electron transport complex protein RnfE